MLDDFSVCGPVSWLESSYGTENHKIRGYSELEHIHQNLQVQLQDNPKNHTMCLRALSKFFLDIRCLITAIPKPPFFPPSACVSWGNTSCARRKHAKMYASMQGIISQASASKEGQNWALETFHTSVGFCLVGFFEGLRGFFSPSSSVPY